MKRNWFFNRRAPDATTEPSADQPMEPIMGTGSEETGNTSDEAMDLDHSHHLERVTGPVSEERTDELKHVFDDHIERLKAEIEQSQEEARADLERARKLRDACQSS